MKQWKWILFLFFTINTIGIRLGYSYTLTTKDGLSLSIDNKGAVESLKVGKKEYIDNQPSSLSGFFMRDVANKSDFTNIEGIITHPEKNKIEQKCRLESLQLEIDNNYIAKDNYIQVNGIIKNLSKGDRAITVYFALPINAEGWDWGTDIRSSTKILDENSEYVNGESVSHGQIGVCSSYPISVISKDVGLSYGVRLDEPRIVRMVYNLKMRTYYIAFDFGLTEDTLKFPNQAKFSFIIYKSEPQWGFRSAIKRYYDIYPELFRKRVEREGIWLSATNILSKDKSPEDFGFTFHHCVRDVDVGDKLGIYSCSYAVPWTQAFYFPEAVSKPTMKEVFETLKIKSESEVKVIYNSGIYDSEGNIVCSIERVGWAKGKAGGGWSWRGNFTMNPDPEIPGGSGIYGPSGFNVQKEGVYEYFKSKGMEVDGVSFDGVSTDGLNFRREHFKYADFPLTFDYETKRPAIVNSFSFYEIVKYFSDFWSIPGKIIMANGVPAHFMFVTHMLDSGNAEVSESLGDKESNLARTLLYQKPYSIMLKGDFSSQEVRGKLESHIRKSLFYGFYVTLFNIWGGGDDTSYFEHPEWYEADRWIFKKYVPIVRKISQAGWEPVTYANSSDTDVFVERYGVFSKNNLYFTLLNTTKKLKTVILSINTTKLNISEDVVIKNILTDERVSADYDREKNRLNIQVPVLGDDVALFQILKRDIREKQNLLQLYLTEGEEEVIPGYKSNLNLKIKNIDTESIRYVKINLNSGSNWDIKALSQTEIAELKPQETISMRYQLDVPENAPLGKVETIKVQMTGSSSKEQLISTEKLLYVESVPIFDVRMYWLTKPEPPGKESEVTVERKTRIKGIEEIKVEIENNTDAKFNGILTLKKPDEWEITPVSQHLDISAKNIKKYDFKVRIPENSKPGKHKIKCVIKTEKDEKEYGEIEIPVNNLALPSDGTTLKVDSSFEGYNAIPLTDGVVDTENIPWNIAAWASSEDTIPHWIELAFSGPKTVSEVCVFWQIEGGAIYTSASHIIQYWNGEKWVDIIKVDNAPNQSFSYSKFPPVTTEKIRIYQDKGCGSKLRRDLMWVMELEVY